MKYTIHNEPGLTIDIVAFHNPVTGPTVELLTTWPTANHPDPHRVLSLTIPPESLQKFASVLEKIAEEATLPNLERRSSKANEELIQNLNPRGTN